MFITEFDKERERERERETRVHFSAHLLATTITSGLTCDDWSLVDLSSVFCFPTPARGCLCRFMAGFGSDIAPLLLWAGWNTLESTACGITDTRSGSRLARRTVFSFLFGGKQSVKKKRKKARNQFH
jgi:hypothetical protein